MFKFTFFISSILILSLSAEEWIAAFNPEIIEDSHPKQTALMTNINKDLDFGARITELDGVDVIHLKIRNGKHKMGDLNLQLKHSEQNCYYTSNRFNLMIPINPLKSNKNGRVCIADFKSKGEDYKAWIEIKSKKIEQRIIVTKAK